MIYPLAGLVLGAVLGAFGAHRRGGNGKDMAQWAAVWAMILGLVGLFVLVFLARAAV